MTFGWSALALAGTLSWTDAVGSSSADTLGAGVTCAGGQSVVGGGSRYDTFWMAGHALEQSAPTGNTAWHTRIVSVEDKPAEPIAYDWDVSALCADASVAACVERVDATSAIDVAPSKTVVATCPPGTLAFAGGAEIVGTQFGHAFRM